MPKKEKTYGTDEKVPNCLVRVHDGKVIQRTDKAEYQHLFHNRVKKGRI